MATGFRTAENDPLVGVQNKYQKQNKTTVIALVSTIILLIVIVIAISVQSAERKWPFNPSEAEKNHNHHPLMYEFQWAPFTPTNDDYSPGSVPTINYDAVSYLAATGDRFGADTIFLGGTNAQFDTMTVDERKQLLATWVNDTIANNYHFKIIFQVLSTQLSESIELSQYAAELNAIYGLPQAIASLPTFWERPTTSDDFEQLIRWLRPVVDAAPGLEFWYNHEPLQTRVLFDMNDFVNVAYNGNADGLSLRELKGTKYVAYSNPLDVFETTDKFSDDANGGTYGGFDLVIWSEQEMGWVSYSKAAGFGGDYYNIPVRKCILKAIENNNYDEAYRLQAWKLEMNAWMGSKVQRRCLHQRISGFDMGPPRQPDLPIDPSVCEDMLDQLEELNYFDQLEQQIKNCV